MDRKKKAGKTAKQANQTKTQVILCITAILAVILTVGFLFARSRAKTGSSTPGWRAYQEKIELLRASILTEQTRATLGQNPAGGQAGQVVFISICNTEERAIVFTGTGCDLESAWEEAEKGVGEFLKKSNYNLQWVKADIVCTSKILDAAELSREVLAARHEFYRYGIAFDRSYETALLEAELNGAKIYDYDNGGFDFNYLNRYLKKAGRNQLEELPEVYTAFQCLGWLCDGENTVYELYSDGLEYGRRAVELIDDTYAEWLLKNAADFLVEQVKEDGSFIYGMYPRFDNEIENYNIVRHASTIWSLICYYRMTGDKELAGVIDKTIEYLLEYVIYKDEHTAYLYEEKDDEIKLGGCGVAVIALTEYMDALGNDRYVDVCRALGNGILTMLDQESGAYYHVLNGDFSKKEEYRTVYYDGEATFALCRLYGATGEAGWLEAAKKAVGHFIAEDYTQYKDHWVAYSMNEITKYVDDPAYYTFALRNAQENLDEIYGRDTTYHTYLELLMATFEVYDRMVERGIQVDYLEDGFDLGYFLRTIYARLDRMLNGYFFSEYAMYMANPQRILNTFMVRHDGYRVRIDDVQHNIDGYYQYYKNYSKMVSYGLLEEVGQGR